MDHFEIVPSILFSQQHLGMGGNIFVEKFAWNCPVNFVFHVILNINKRPLSLTAPLSNNTLSMIHSPINTKWHWFDLSMPPKVKCHEVNWKTIYDLLCVYENLWDTTPWKVCDLDLTLKGNQRSKITRSTERSYIWLCICASYKH